MALESQKKKQMWWLLSDPYDLDMAIPKELNSNKKPELHFRIPDLGQSMRVKTKLLRQ